MDYIHFWKGGFSNDITLGMGSIAGNYRSRLSRFLTMAASTPVVEIHPWLLTPFSEVAKNRLMRSLAFLAPNQQEPANHECTNANPDGDVDTLLFIDRHV